MPVSASSSAQAAREALAVRLTHLRRDAGLTGRELSARCGWHPAKTTRIQKADVHPSDTDIRAWCAACNAADQAEDLVATARAVDSMYREWRRIHASGMRRAQDDWSTWHERASMVRVYCPNGVAGVLQTADYAAALLRSITRFQGTPDDVTDAVAARMARSRLLYEGQRRFVVLLEEWVLHARIADPATMVGQLRHLLALIGLPSLALGIIPLRAPRRMWPLEGFYIFDDSHVAIETLTAEINVKAPRELADYLKAFQELAAMAVYGNQARELIEAAILHDEGDYLIHDDERPADLGPLVTGHYAHHTATVPADDIDLASEGEDDT